MATIAVIGPGAIGCAFAAAAMQAGHAIAIAARTPFTTLDVTYQGGHVTGPVQPLSLATAKPFDLVMLATKAHQTLEAAPWLAKLCGDHTILAVLQNGVEHVERATPLVNANVQIVPAMVACPSDRSAPGTANVTGPARLDVPTGPVNNFRRFSPTHSPRSLLSKTGSRLRGRSSWSTPLAAASACSRVAEMTFSRTLQSHGFTRPSLPK